MVKARLLEVVTHAVFHAGRGVGGKAVGAYLHRKGKQVKPYEVGQGVKDSGHYVVVDGIALEKRDDDIHRTADDSEQRHKYYLTAVALKKGQYPFYAEPGQTDSVAVFFLFG